jgi:hypothetical protein
VRADYVDVFRGETLTVTATVETEPPAIGDILVDPYHTDAVVAWETSEPADALVQFGESALLGRTAYSASQEDFHAVTLEGLLPDHVYYFRVVSRDRAGNVSMDDNGGLLYSFRTLTPVFAPWADQGESGDAEWSITGPDESERGWRLGVPHNYPGAEAHSPTRAWGTNLDGDEIGQMESYLVTPAIYLAGGNKASLRFWQNYDFASGGDTSIELGEVVIITNITTAPVTLMLRMGDFSDGWEEVEEIDLTPYLGQVVYLAWHYFYLTFEVESPPGWLVDDVAIEISNQIPGTIQITNNLAQGSFSLAGPLSRSGHGWSLLLTNAPPGEYRVAFGDVPFHRTPAPQTNTLASSAMLRFVGNYTFADANDNAMSDDWESFFFHEVSPQRGPTADTDGDGCTDYAEFQAGTDPTTASSRLVVLTPIPQADGGVRLQWPSAIGRAYRVEASSDAVHWAPVTGWLQATTGTTATLLSRSALGPAYLFRLEVRP